MVYLLPDVTKTVTNHVVSRPLLRASTKVPEDYCITNRIPHPVTTGCITITPGRCALSAVEERQHPGRWRREAGFTCSAAIISTDMLVDFLCDHVFWHGSKHLVDNLAIFENKK